MHVQGKTLSKRGQDILHPNPPPRLCPGHVVRVNGQRTNALFLCGWGTDCDSFRLLCPACRHTLASAAVAARRCIAVREVDRTNSLSSCSPGGRGLGISPTSTLIVCSLHFPRLTSVLRSAAGEVSTPFISFASAAGDRGAVGLLGGGGCPPSSNTSPSLTFGMLTHNRGDAAIANEAAIAGKLAGQ